MYKSEVCEEFVIAFSLNNRLYLEKTLSIDEGDQNVKAKSASIISRRTTAQERAVTSVHSNRSRKTAEQTKPGVRNPRQINQSKGRDDGSSKNSAKSSTRSKYENVENEKKDDHVKSANSKILKPIIEKPNKDHGTALKAKIFVFNEAEAQENVKNSSEDKTKISKNHKDESSNAKITVYSRSFIAQTTKVLYLFLF